MKKSNVITKKQAVSHYRTQTALAKALGVTKGAVSQWPEGPLPRVHQLALRYEIAPDVFGAK